MPAQPLPLFHHPLPSPAHVFAESMGITSPSPSECSTGSSKVIQQNTMGPPHPPEREERERREEGGREGWEKTHTHTCQPAMEGRREGKRRDRETEMTLEVRQVNRELPPPFPPFSKTKTNQLSLSGQHTHIKYACTMNCQTRGRKCSAAHACI